MEIIKYPAEMINYADAARAKHKKIGFVPTLGNLHEGHTKLIKAAKKECDLVVVSIFVNPTQFGPNEDLENYPRSEQEDLKICQEERVDLVFMPQAKDIYVGGDNPLTQVDIHTMTGLHCGVSRPTHFIGVLTIVALLFNLVKPHCAAFGKKDFQQLRLIQIMKKELHFPLEIIAVDTGRTPDGLALSSRNRYLTKEERQLAPQFYQHLQHLASKISSNPQDYRKLEEVTAQELEKAGFRVDYVNIVRQTDLLPAEPTPEQNLAILGAVYLGKARLIDNVILGKDMFGGKI